MVVEAKQRRRESYMLRRANTRRCTVPGGRWYVCLCVRVCCVCLCVYVSVRYSYESLEVFQ
jgi:hypothetical protein